MGLCGQLFCQKMMEWRHETGIFEAVYNFTCITILNAVGPTRVVYGSAAEFHPYDQPKLIFIFDS